MLENHAPQGRPTRVQPAVLRFVMLFGFLWTAAIGLRLYTSLLDVARHTETLMRQRARSYVQLIQVTGLLAPDEQPNVVQPGASSRIDEAGETETARRAAELLAEEDVTFRIVNGPQSSNEQPPDEQVLRGAASIHQGPQQELRVAKDGASFTYMTSLRAASGTRKGGTLPAGVLAVNIPSGPFAEPQGLQNRKIILMYALIWTLGLVGIIAGTYQTLRKQRLAEAALQAARESESRFRHLFEEAPIAYHEIDAFGVVCRVNQAECSLLGFDAQAMIGLPVWQFVAPGERSKSQEAVHAKISGRQTLAPFCREYLRSDGIRLNLEIHENLIHDERNQVVGIRSALLDVTAREHARHELSLRTQELARSNAELEQFAYVASHDLQEPLRKIMAFGDRLKTRCKATLDPQGLDYLERMQSASGRMQQLITALLTFSRIRTKAQPTVAVGLNTVLQDVIADLEVRIEHLGGHVEVGDLPTVKADPSQMSQLFMNLIGNALKFHRAGTPPIVRISSHANRQPDRVGTWFDILVQDNGIGFEQKYEDRIFQVFQRLHGRSEYEGTGIGLAVCRAIVERHGGSITAHSIPGEGSTFIATLQAAHIDARHIETEKEREAQEDDHTLCRR